jgi:hypothetical protein
MTNTFCNGRVKNNNPKSPIQYFDLVTVREFSDYEGGTIIDIVTSAEHFLDTEEEALDDPFYQIYGKRYIDDKKSKVIFLGEFYTLDKAKEFLYNLTGEIPDIISY